MDGVPREVNVRVLYRGLNLLSDDGREWNVNQLLFANDTSLVAHSQGRFKQLV